MKHAVKLIFICMFFTALKAYPCTISQVLITEPQSIKGIANKKRFMEKVRDILAVKPGDACDREGLNDRVRGLREFLEKEDFILADTDDVQFTFSPDKQSAQVRFNVKYGERVSFGFLGNTVFSKGELTGIIDSLKNTDLGKDYIDVILRKFIEEYKARAYGEVAISTVFTETSQGKRVTFNIEENNRQWLKSVSFEGLSPEFEKQAMDVFFEKNTRLIQRGYYVEKDVDRGGQLVVEHLKSMGFLTSKVMSKTVIPMKKKDNVQVSIQFFEGEQTRIGQISITGGLFLNEERIHEILGLNLDAPFNPFKFEEGIDFLKTEYIRSGYLYMKIETNPDQIVKFYDHNRRVDVQLHLEEGVRVKVGDVRIEGLEQTKSYVIEREIEVKKGDWWLGNSVIELEDSLRRLGIFAEVKTRAESSKYGPEYRDMVVEVREGEPGALELGPGFRSDLGLRGFARITYANLFGRNMGVSLQTDANRRLGGVFPYRFIEYGVQTIFIVPRILDTRNTLSFGLSTSKRQFINFNAAQAQFFAGIDRRLFLKNLFAKFTYRLERIRQFGAPSAIDNQTLLLGSVTPALTFDTRNSPFSATKGQISSLSFEYSLPELVAHNTNSPRAVSYYKWAGSTHMYFSLPEGIIWSNVISAGFSKNLIPESEIPLIKMFRLGGYSSIRGFQEDSINKDKLAIRGSLSFFNVRTQFDLPVAGDLKFAPFLDAGNLFVDTPLMGSPFLRVGVGAGLHYSTPIGPINFDYGLKLNRRENEGIGQFHFSVGII